jgi:asparagine synthase (glutamine-hydrolysing)
MQSKSVIGTFNRNKNLSESLKAENGLSPIYNTVYGTGYQTTERAGTALVIWQKVYNLNEVKTVIGSGSTEPADLLLDLYEKEGTAGFRRLDGKFTIIILEPEKTIVVRDRNGEGPMIYYTADFFVSAYKDLFLFKDFKAEPDLTGITTFLKIGYIPAPTTSLKGVSKLPAGHILEFSKAGFSISELYGYREIINRKRNEISKEDAIHEYEDLLKKSLKKRIGDAETAGALLSGGYDSGGNIALLREVHPATIKSYSIGFKDNPASELPYAKMMAEKFGAEHHEYTMDGTEIEFLPDIIEIMGDPFSESGFMLNHSAMKMVSAENLPVVIGGDGNDQYFGAGIRETALHYTMRKKGIAPLSRFFDKISDNKFFDNDNLAFRVHFQNQKILRVMEPETFGFHDFQLKRMFEMKSVEPHHYLEEIPSKFGDYEDLFLQRNYFLHLRHTVNEVIIYKASRISEAFGVNLAFSYTDLDIYNFLQDLPIHLRAKGTVEECMKGKGVTKFIHKQLVKPKLPDAVTNRPKQGGFSPLEIFFNDESRRKKIYYYIKNSAFGKSLKSNDFLDEFFNKYENLCKGKGYWFWYKQVKSNQLINLLIISIWWDKLIEGRKDRYLSDFLE